MNPDLSVIIPVYNVCNYLEKCLRTISSQTYNNFECILVDDGSSDGSLNICEEWSKRDSRFIVIHQENAGVSKARNVGLDLAQGQFVIFVDSDDWISVDCFEMLVHNMQKFDTDISVCGIAYHHVDKLNLNIPAYTGVFEFLINNINQFVDLNKKDLLCGPCAKIYKMSIIKKYRIRFDVNISYGEDLIFNYLYLEYVTRCGILNECLYHYRILRSGTLSSIYREDKWDIDYYQWQMLFNFYTKKGWLSSISLNYLKNRLWGILYDSIFPFNSLNVSKKCKLKSINRILSIKEIEILSLKDSFQSPLWIKFTIKYRMYWIFGFVK